MGSEVNGERLIDDVSQYWGMADSPRIRSITGVRIRQLTLPQSLALTSRHRLSSSLETSLSVPEDGYFLGESSRLATSPSASALRRANSSASQEPSRRERRISLSGYEDPGSPKRSRAGSNATLGPGIETPRATETLRTSNQRVTRPRSRTLAGEVLEHQQHPEAAEVVGEGDEVAEESKPNEASQRRQLARCFIVFRLLPPRSAVLIGGTDSKADIKGKGRAVQPDEAGTLRRTISVQTRPSRSTSMEMFHSSDRNGGTSPASPNGVTPPRSRTTSVNTLPSPAAPNRVADNPDKADPMSTSTGTLLKLGQRPPRLVRAGSEAGRNRPSARPVSMISRGSYRSPHLSGICDTEAVAGKLPTPATVPMPVSGVASSQVTTPFFISPIHPPSSHPAFPSLSPESDFASWLSMAERASQMISVEVWYEDEERGWVQLSGVGGSVKLGALRRVENAGQERENRLEFCLKGETGVWFAVPEASEARVGDQAELAGTGVGRRRGASVRGVLERSVRETRMKKGAGIGSLHQLVHGQMVVADTQQNIAVVKGNIDELLRQDADRRALRREVNERSERVKWIQSKIDEIDLLSREVDAAIVIRRKAIADRRKDLVHAEERDDVDRSRATRLDEAIYTAVRSNLLPLIHHYRAHHIQTLDALFPILPLSPSILLYGILAVPLPIPSGKDPAPPITLLQAILPDGVKVDERTTAAALGYVAMVVHILGNLGGNGPGAGGLVYPITCAGSRSLVRDVVSVMQGPRSFPLYTKGVERYRFDYAVFLLNTNIELLMQEANIRLVDRRHTLPNLKSLLLTLSSPTPSPPPPSYRSGSNLSHPASGTTTYNNSRAGSRQTSHTFHSPFALGMTRDKFPASASVSSIGDILGSVAGSHLKQERESQSMSPAKVWSDPAAVKRSHLSGQSWGGSDVGGDGETAVSSVEITSEIDTEGYD